MKFFRLTTSDCVERIRQHGGEPMARTLGNHLLVGSLGFCAVSLLSFSIWAFAARPLYQTIGEVGMYAVIALAFVGLSGALFNRLLIAPGTLGSFYGLFTASFVSYSILWSLAWFMLAKPLGARPAGVVAALLGTIAMSACLSSGLGSWQPFWKNTLFLFVAHTLGYFLGDLLFSWLLSESGARSLEGILSKPARIVAAKLSWGLGYGLGFGLGIGHNLYQLQAPLRVQLNYSQSAQNPLAPDPPLD